MQENAVSGCGRSEVTPVGRVRTVVVVLRICFALLLRELVQTCSFDAETCLGEYSMFNTRT